MSFAAPPPLEVTGRVLDESGVPLAGAEVSLMVVPGPLEAARLEIDGRGFPDPVARARSGEDGSYRLVAPEIGVYRIHVAAGGRAPMLWGPLPLVEEREIEPVRLPRDLGGSVLVVDAEGRPLAGARVRAARDPRQEGGLDATADWSAAEQWGVTDAAGRLAYARAGRLDYELVALAANRPPAVASGVRSGSSRLELRDGAAVRVETRAGDRPSGGAALWLASPRVALGFSDELGLANIVVAKEGALVVARDAASGTARDRVGAPRRSQGEAAGRLRLEPPRRVLGRVIDAESRAPIPGALVYERSTGSEWTLTDARGFALAVAPGEPMELAAAARGYLEISGRGEPLDPASSTGPTIALAATASIAGVVVDREGTPVPEADVTAEPLRGFGTSFLPPAESQPRRTRSDPRGTFRFSALTPARGWQLTARRAGFGAGRAIADGVAPGRTTKGVRIVLPPESQLSGRVVAANRDPIAGARVELAPAPLFDLRRILAPRPRPEDHPRAESDAGGRFAFSGLGPGTYDLALRAAGFAPTRIPRAEVGEGTVLDLGEIVLGPGIAVDGRVVDREGQPLAGVEILLATTLLRIQAVLGDFQGLEPAAVTGEDGRFEIPDRRAGERVDLVAHRSGLAFATQLGVAVPPPRPLRFVLEPLARIRGRVFDADGRPARAMVSAWVARRAVDGASGGMQGRVDTGRVPTDVDGTFELADVPDGEVTVTAVGAEGEVASRTGLELAAGGVIEGVELRFEAGARLAGRVIEPDGRAAIGALVSVSGAGRAQRDSDSTLTDGDGRFALRGLPPGSLTVVARKSPHRRAVRELEIPASEAEIEVELQLGAGRAVRGRAVDGRSAAVAEALISLSAPGVGGGRFNALSGVDGSFELAGVEPGRYQIVASKPGFGRAEPPEPLVVEESDVEGVLLRLEPGGTIAGRVLGLEPDDLAQVRLTARTERGFAGTAPSWDGSYRLEGLAAGEWAVEAQLRRSGRRATGRVTIPEPPEEVTLDLEFGRGYVLSGQVLWRGAAAPGAWVSASGGASPVPASVQADADGRFRLEGLTEGTYQVRAGDSAGRAWAFEQIDLVDDSELRLELASARIEGEVRDARGDEPIRGADVQVVPVAGEPAPLVRMYEEGGGTNEDGAYFRDGVGLGEQRVLASAEGYAAAERRVTIVDRDQVERVDFRLEPNQGIRLRVRGANGLPPERISAAAIGPEGAAIWSGSVATGEGGSVRLSSVPPGEWTLLVGSWEAPVVRLRVSSPGDAGEVVLPRPGLLRVRVPGLEDGAASILRLIGADGEPYVYLGASEPRSEYRMQGRDLSISRLPPGIWTVEVTAADGRRWTGAATVASEVETEVILE